MVARLQRRRFEESADVRAGPKARSEIVEFGDRVVARLTVQPGWRWSVDVKPVAGTEFCRFHHVGMVMSGRLRTQMSDGAELEVGPGDLYETPPGHDAWVVGDQPCVMVDFEATLGFGRPRSGSARRSLASILLTDIVDSTSRAVTIGPAAWADVISGHNRLSDRAIQAHEGQLLNTTGDGVIALFDSAERAIRAAVEIAAAVSGLGVRIRAAVHSGEIELSAGDVRGVAVHAAARMMALAGPGDVVVSATVRDLVDGSGLEFEDLGLHKLKGLPVERQLYRLKS